MVDSTHQSQIFINGEWVESISRERLPVISPFTEETIAEVPSGSRGDIDKAVEAARAAFEDTWSRTSLEERLGMLERLRVLLMGHHEELAQLITHEMGCPITQARELQVPAAITALDSYLQEARRFPFREIRESFGGARALVVREPIGVVAAITPWNVPLGIPLSKIVPALIMGCTVVLKPAPETPLMAYEVARLLLEAGMPAGVVNVVPAGREVGEYLVTHPGVAKVAFTGSSVAGKRIAALSGEDLRHVTLELGGKSAAVLLNDADIDQATEALRMGSFRNSGQICTLKTRVLVSRKRHDELVDRLDRLIGSMPVGDPRNEATQIGPLVSERQRDRVEDYIRIAQEEGAGVARGGGRPSEFAKGWFVEPALLVNVERGMRIAQEEVFGPVLAVIPFEDEDDAVAIANDSEFGLNGAVFTSDFEHGLAVAERIRSGAVEINASSIGLRAPMGGVKSSGLGRENGPEGLSAYSEQKSIGLPAGISDDLVLVGTRTS